MVAKKNIKKGRLVLDDIKFDQVLKRRVMRSGNVGKIYTPKDFIDRDIFIVLPRRKKNELNSFL